MEITTHLGAMRNSSRWDIRFKTKPRAITISTFIISFVFTAFQAVVALNLNMNFLIAILVCLAIILTAVVVLAVYRRKRNVYT